MYSQLHVKFLAAAAVLGVSAQVSSAQHINAGAVGQNANDKLVWANGAAYVNTSGYAKQLTKAETGTYAGYYQGAVTFTALHSNVAGGPAPGSFLVAEVVSLDGPAGGSFGFWEEGALAPTFSLASGTTGASQRFDLSSAEDGAGAVGADAYGHLHGRRQTATVEGVYTLGIRAVDTSVNGPGGGPIHAPSDVFYLNFYAVPEPSVLAMAGVGLMGMAWMARRRLS